MTPYYGPDGSAGKPAIALIAALVLATTAAGQDFPLGMERPFPPPSSQFDAPLSDPSRELDRLADAIVRDLESDPELAVLLRAPHDGNPRDDDSLSRSLHSPLSSLIRDRFVLDLGYSYSRDGFDGFTLEQHATPDLLFRYSMTDRLELRVGWSGWISESLIDEVNGTSATDTSFADPSVGVKYRLCRQRGPRPQLFALISAPIAMDGDPLTLDNFQPMTSVIYGWRLSEKWSAYGATSLAYRHDDGDDFCDLQQSATLDRLINDRWGAYAQWTYLLPDGDRTCEHEVYGGLYWMPTASLQFDTRIGVGANREATDLIVGTGCTIAF